jgi:hypothetical protein
MVSCPFTLSSITEYINLFRFKTIKKKKLSSDFENFVRYAPVEL